MGSVNWADGCSLKVDLLFQADDCSCVENAIRMNENSPEMGFQKQDHAPAARLSSAPKPEATQTYTSHPSNPCAKSR